MLLPLSASQHLESFLVDSVEGAEAAPERTQDADLQKGDEACFWDALRSKCRAVNGRIRGGRKSGDFGKGIC